MEDNLLVDQAQISSLWYLYSKCKDLITILKRNHTVIRPIVFFCHFDNKWVKLWPILWMICWERQSEKKSFTWLVLLKENIFFFVTFSLFLQSFMLGIWFHYIPIDLKIECPSLCMQTFEESIWSTISIIVD